MEENKELVELLKQIDKSTRQQTLTGRLLCVFALVTALCCVVTFVMIWSIVPQVSGLVTQAQTVLGNLEQATEELAALDLEGMVANVDTMMLAGQQSMELTMEKLNGIDIETLNQAIEDLAAVVEPLANFFSVFN